MLSPANDTGASEKGVPGGKRELAGVLFASFFLVALFSYLPHLLPWLAPYSSVFIAASFIYIPAYVLWRKRHNFEDIGVAVGFSLKSAMTCLAVMGLIFPVFSLCFFLYQQEVEGRSPCISGDRMRVWSDQLESWDGRLGEDLVLATKGERLALYNNSEVDRTLQLDWEPRQADARKGTFNEQRVQTSLSVGPGRVLLRPGHVLLFAEEVESVAIDEAGARPNTEPNATMLLGSGQPETLPFRASRGGHWILYLLLMQLLLVALPEEVFYRGYVQSRLSGLLKARVLVFGGDIGPAVLLTSVLFAVGHLIAIPHPGRLAVFFPSLLFGWLRSRTGSVAPSILMHGMSNVLLAILSRFVC